MPQQFLNFPQIGTHVEQMRGIAVAQPMGMHAIRDPSRSRSSGQDPADIAVA
jgi:hypothetical protein